jgi:predicted NAD-dependent protein-ADP-ribosyltransferase YbiA (DUF1768 family)
MSVIAFTNVAYPYGWLGNMSPYPIDYQGVHYRTTEALFQCLRFPNSSRARRAIRAEKSPMGAKMLAKTYRGQLKVPLRDKADLKRMELCLRLKCRQHPQLREWLVKTGKAVLIEDCTARRKDIEIDGTGPANGLPFWGVAWNPGTRCWEGVNALGVLWMKLRKQFQSKLPRLPRTPPSFIGHQYGLKVKARRRARIMKARLAKAKELRANGESCARIAAKLRVSPQDVLDWEKKGFRFSKV